MFEKVKRIFASHFNSLSYKVQINMVSIRNINKHNHFFFFIDTMLVVLHLAVHWASVYYYGSDWLVSYHIEMCGSWVDVLDWVGQKKTIWRFVWNYCCLKIICGAYFWEGVMGWEEEEWIVKHGSAEDHNRLHRISEQWQWGSRCSQPGARHWLGSGSFHSWEISVYARCRQCISLRSEDHVAKDTQELVVRMESYQDLAETDM